MTEIDLGKDYYPSLTNRDEHQRDGKFSGLDFRRKYLNGLDDESAWKDDSTFITINFSNVKRIGPSWANEAFAYFTRYSTPDKILIKIKFQSISRVKLELIKKELETGYSERR